MATTEDEILKTLQRIERAMGSSTTTSGLGRAPSAPRAAGSQRNNNNNNTEDQASVRTRKTFQATTAVLNTLNDSTRTLNRSFTGLNRTILNTRSNFIEMNRSMRVTTRSAPQNVNDQQPVVDPTSNIIDSLSTALNQIIPRVLRRAEPPPIPRVEPTPAPTPAGPRPPTPRVNPNPPPTPGGPRPPGPRGNPILDLFGGRGSPGGALTRGFGDLASRVNFAGVAIVSIINQLSGAVVPVVRDVLMLHSAGIQASSALGGLYIDAARSGMSLREYTKVLQDSSPAVTRALSMDDFNKQLQVSRDRLENLGIFGEEATKLSASLATSATVLGIPQAKLADATNTQISTFEQLRKASLLTAEQFQNLTAQLASQQEVQSQLLGLSGPQRAARLAELTEMKTFGLSLGASKEASDAFGDALIKQRNLTAPKRFEAAGRIRQSGAILGMDATDTEQLAQLSRKKNLTGDDKETALRLGSQLQSRIEAAMNSGNVNQENIAEQLQSSLDSSGIGNLLRTAGNVDLQTQSGQAGVNKDFATGTSNLIKATGRLMSWLDGIEKNPVASAISGALGSAAFSLGLGAAIGRILSRGRLGPPTPGAGPAAGGAGGLLERLFGGRAGGLDGAGGGPPRPGAIRTTIQGARDVISGAWDILTRITNFRTLGPTLAQAGQSILGAFQSVSGAATGALSSAASFARGLIGSVSSFTNALQVSYQILRGTGSSALGAIGTIVGDLSATLSGTLGGALKTIFTGAFGFLGRTGIISAVIGGAMELFTGDLASALNAEDESTWFGGGLKGLVSKTLGKIGSVLGGMIRGFATGITGLGDMILDVWNWSIGSFFDGMKIELDHSLTNLFDQSWTSIMIMFKELQVKVKKFFGLDTKDIEADIAVAKKSRDTLEKDGTATLTSIGDNNQKLSAEQKAAADKTTKNIASATKNIGVAAGVITSTQGLTQRILADSAGVRDQQVKSVGDAAKATGLVLPSADAASDAAADIKAANERAVATVDEQKKIDKATLAKATSSLVLPKVDAATDAITDLKAKTERMLATPAEQKQIDRVTLATPGQTQRTGVTDPTLNKPAEAPPPVAQAPTPVTPGLPQQTPIDLLNVKFDTMILLLQQMLTAEQLQAAGLEGLARGLGRPAFADNEAAFRLLNQS